jgi:hypothetical protein
MGRSNWIDSVSAVPAFPGLRRFPDGRDFSQWTGDDSKALMKVELLFLDAKVYQIIMPMNLGLYCCNSRPGTRRYD